MAQEITRRSISEEVRVRSRLNLSEVCGGQSVTGTGFCQSYSALSVLSFHRGFAHTYIIWSMDNRPFGGRSLETWSHPHRHVQLSFSIQKETFLTIPEGLWYMNLLFG
jgi:hypothetical protein